MNTCLDIIISFEFQSNTIKNRLNMHVAYITEAMCDTQTTIIN